jgi:hypothetical protein
LTSLAINLSALFNWFLDWGTFKLSYIWGRFHQPFGAKHKCAGSYSLSSIGAIQFHQQNYAQLNHYAQLENMLNFYTVSPKLCSSKISINLLAQKLCVKCWWNWLPHLKTKHTFAFRFFHRESHLCLLSSDLSKQWHYFVA